MGRKKRNGLILITAVLLTIVVIFLVVDRTGKSGQKEAAITLDYSNIDAVVARTLQEEPLVLSQINNIQANVDDSETISLKDLFSVEKTKFREKVVVRLIDEKQYSERKIKQKAEKIVESYVQALENAEKKYDITITQQEVTNYIEQQIQSFQSEEKNLYAKALGLTLEELDYQFDRDTYVVNLLFEKLTPLLIEEYPQSAGEDSNAYYRRLQMEVFK